MIKRVFSVYDSKAKYYFPPFMMREKGEAIRSFSTWANDEQLDLCRHPEDYVLFELGTWDELTGKYENLLAPLSLGIAIEYKKVKYNPQMDLPLGGNNEKLVTTPVQSNTRCKDSKVIV